MKFLKKALVVSSAMLMAMPSLASASDIIGYFTNVTGDVLVERNGEMLRVANNSAIMSGDKLIAWHGGNAGVKLNAGCDTVLAQDTFIQIGAGNHCSAISRSSQFQGVETQVADGTYMKTVAGGGTGGGMGAMPLILVAGGVAAIVAVVASADDSTPAVSP